jgi:hypothetical protein
MSKRNKRRPSSGAKPTRWTLLFGFDTADIKAARRQVERKLNCQMAAHESLFLGGDYFILGSHASDEHVLLRNNVDLLDETPEERDFPGFPILLYFRKTAQPELVEGLLQGTRFQLLRRQPHTRA